MYIRQCIYRKNSICTLRGDVPNCCYEVSRPILFLNKILRRNKHCMYEEPFFRG
jgi:hypothetical protein